MEFTSDAKYSNIEIESTGKGMVYVPVKNNYSEYGNMFVPNSVFDVHPDTGSGKYRQEPLLKYNELHESWELNAYFIETTDIVVPEPPKIFEVTNDVLNTELTLRINMSLIPNTTTNDRFNVFEVFFDNVEFSEADDLENTNDNITSDAEFSYDIFQAQGNALQCISIENNPLQDLEIKIAYVSAPNEIKVNEKSYIANSMYGKYSMN